MIQLSFDLRQHSLAFPFCGKASALWYGFRTIIGNKPMARAGAYGIYCIPNGKWYVGITGVSVAKRLIQHRWKPKGTGTKFMNALSRYGFSNFIVVPLFYCIGDNGNDLPAIEQTLIKDYCSSGKGGYNTMLSNGVVGPLGQEFGEIISAAKKKHFTDPENLARHKARIKKSHQRPEVRAKLSASLTAYYANPEARLKASAIRKKAFDDIDAKVRQSEAQRKRFADPEARAATSAATRKAMARPDVLEKVSKASVETWKDPEVRERRLRARSVSSKIEWQDPEIRAKRSAGIKASWQNPEIRAKRIAAIKATNKPSAAD